MTRRVAAVDIGTNSTNLLVRDESGSVLERHVTITRLGRGVDSSRRLAADAIERTSETLRHYAGLLARHGVDTSRDLRVVTTSAARDAANRDEFFTAVNDAIGRIPDVLSGDDEGRLAHRGALSDLDIGHGWHLLVDIGGGSTELVLGESTATGLAMRAVRSLDVGAVRLTERHLQADPPRPEELTNAIGDAYDLIDDALRDVPDMKLAARLVGSAGTIVTAAAVEMGQREFDPSALHGFVLGRAAVEDVFRTLATESIADRVHNPGLPADRADVIVGGLCVLVAVMRRWDARDILVSAHNIMDGICAELLETP
ncbi:MAG: Ppx/GppA phosphatase family protein [Actinomycetota bacterium]|nr:Ppx/GppA phosphatase family protein [Actinomycetota bacterium]MDA2972250.1 Ppx/GppA phosphatase family protein [Actinomycetota bacterium]MDA3002019.1 Ppx/GppA phosphatase family protein [Actinomycetota bacterium]